MTGTFYDGINLNFSFDSASFGKQQSTAERSEAGQQVSESINGVKLGLREGFINPFPLSNTLLQIVVPCKNKVIGASAVSDNEDVASGHGLSSWGELITPLLYDTPKACLTSAPMVGQMISSVDQRSCVVDKNGDFSIASSNGLDSNRLLVSRHNVSMEDLESKASSCKINPMLNCQIKDFGPRCFIGSNEGNNPEPKAILTTKTPKQFYFMSFVSPWVAPSSSWAD
jgi:hypothetical protein